MSQKGDLMKKITCLFTACLAFFVFYMMFTVSGSAERERIDNFMSAVKEENQLNPHSYFIDLNAEEIDGIQSLIEFAEENGYVAILGDSQTDGSSRVDSWYIYDQGNKHFAFLNLKNKKYFSFSSSQDSYISSTASDTKSFDVIDFLDQRNGKDYQTAVRLYPLSQYRKHSSAVMNSLYLFTDKSLQEHEKLINNSSLSAFLDEGYELHYSTPPEVDMKTILMIMGVCVTAICLLFVVGALKNRKEIMLRKLLGCTSFYIARKLMTRQLLLYFGVYLSVQILLFIGLTGLPRPASMEFLFQLFKYAGIFAAFLAAVFCIMLAYIQRSHSFLQLKIGTASKTANYLNLIVKFAVLLLILPLLISFVKLGVTAVSEYSYMTSHKEEMRNQVYIYSIDDRQTIGNVDTIKEKIFKFMIENGAIYQDFESYESIMYSQLENPDDSFIMAFKPFIIANDVYLSNYEMIDTEGNSIHVKDYKDETMFVPKGTELQEETIGYYCTTNCTIVPIQSGTTFWNQNVNDEIRSLRDPIVVYRPQVDMSSYGAYRLNIKDPKVEVKLKEFLKENQLDKVVSLNHTSKDYDIRIEKYKDDLLFLMPLLVTYGFVVLIFIYQSCFIYFMQNNQKFAIRYMLGNSFLERHGDMIFQNLIIYIPLLLILYLGFHIPAKDTLLSVLLVVLLELSGSYILVHRLEKKRMTEILKRGE